MPDVNVSVQVIPLCEDIYAVVDRAIAAIAASGVPYEVGPMETTMEGDLDRLLEIARTAHRACFVDGVHRVLTLIKIDESVGGTSIAEKVDKYRE